MKKLIVLLLSMVAILTILAGCRRQTNENPGDPTVNSTTADTTVPTTTGRATRPSTEPTMDATIPDGTISSGDDFTQGSDSSEDAAINSEARRRDRMLPRR